VRRHQLASVRANRGSEDSKSFGKDETRLQTAHWRAVSFPNGRRKRFHSRPRPDDPAPSPQPGMPQAETIENLYT